MIEPEIAFADLKDDMELAEDMLKYIINYCLENAPEEMQFFNQFIDKELLDRLNHVVNSEFAHVTYTEAVNILIEDSKAGKVKFDNKVEWGCDLQTEHERYLTEQVFKRPLFVTDYPKEIKAFYMKLNDDQKTVAAMDLLVPGIGEIIGGSQREENYDVLVETMPGISIPANTVPCRMPDSVLALKELLCILQVFLTFVTYFRSQEQSVLPNINQDKTIAVLTTILRGCLQPLDFYKERYDFYEFNCSSYCTCYNYCSV